MRVLITGAAGAIGREIAAELDTDHELYLVDKIPLGAVWIMLFIKVARTACRVPYLTHIIGSFGKASMMIMLLHQYIQMELLYSVQPLWHNSWVRIALALAIPLSLYFLQEKISVYYSQREI